MFKFVTAQPTSYLCIIQIFDSIINQLYPEAKIVSMSFTSYLSSNMVSIQCSCCITKSPTLRVGCCQSLLRRQWLSENHYHSSSATSVSALLPHRTINGVIHHPTPPTNRPLSKGRSNIMTQIFTTYRFIKSSQLPCIPN